MVSWWIGSPIHFEQTTNMRTKFSLAILSLLLLVGCRGRESATPPAQQKATAFVAASTKGAVDEIAQKFKSDAGIEVEVVSGPSSGLAKQIEQGAGADLFLSADQASFEYLEEKQLTGPHRKLLANRLVVITPVDSMLEIKSLQDLAGPEVKRLALGEPKVPVGEYARQALEKVGILNELKDKTVGGIDVKATLQFVARGEAEAGIVYWTDTLGNSKVRVAYEIPLNLHQPIEYPLVVLKRANENSAALRFYEYLGSAQAAEIFKQKGFLVISGPP
jgi:molybdate transport system substrate-binding protein